MRTPSTRFLVVLCTAFVLATMGAACGDDSGTTGERPADGTVPIWESCLWEGSNTPDLCEEGLLCSDQTICMPACETVADCPKVKGFEVECFGQAATFQKPVCVVMCNEALECPMPGTAETRCINPNNWCT